MARPPIVICADLGSWEALVALGAALTRSGITVIRFTSSPPSRWQRGRVWLERPAFTNTRTTLRVSESGELDITDLRPWLVRAKSIQAVDVLGARLADDPVWAEVPHLHRVSADGLSDADLYDKLRYTRLAAGAGVPVPQTFTRAADLPHMDIVTKPRIGSGGQGVRFHTDPEDLGTYLARKSPDEVFIQERAQGTPWGVGGYARGGRLLVGAAYRMVPSAGDPTGPAVDVQLRDRPDLLEYAERITRLYGYTGPIQVDFIDTAGGPLMIDINPRFFSAWATLQSIGVDILGAYEATLLDREFQPARPPTPPDHPVPALRGGNGVEHLWRRNRRLRRQLGPVLGHRWQAVEAGSGMVAVARRRFSGH